MHYSYALSIVRDVSINVFESYVMIDEFAESYLKFPFPTTLKAIVSILERALGLCFMDHPHLLGWGWISSNQVRFSVFWTTFLICGSAPSTGTAQWPSPDTTRHVRTDESVVVVWGGALPGQQTRTLLYHIRIPNSGDKQIWEYIFCRLIFGSIEADSLQVGTLFASCFRDLQSAFLHCIECDILAWVDNPAK